MTTTQWDVKDKLSPADQGHTPLPEWGLSRALPSWGSETPNPTAGKATGGSGPTNDRPAGSSCKHKENAISYPHIMHGAKEELKRKDSVSHKRPFLNEE